MIGTSRADAYPLFERSWPEHVQLCRALPENPAGDRLVTALLEKAPEGFTVEAAVMHALQRERALPPDQRQSRAMVGLAMKALPLPPLCQLVVNRCWPDEDRSSVYLKGLESVAAGHSPGQQAICMLNATYQASNGSTVRKVARSLESDPEVGGAAQFTGFILRSVDSNENAILKAVLAQRLEGDETLVGWTRAALQSLQGNPVIQDTLACLQALEIDPRHSAHAFLGQELVRDLPHEAFLPVALAVVDSAARNEPLEQTVLEAARVADSSWGPEAMRFVMLTGIHLLREPAEAELAQALLDPGDELPALQNFLTAPQGGSLPAFAHYVYPHFPEGDEIIARHLGWEPVALAQRLADHVEREAAPAQVMNMQMRSRRRPAQGVEREGNMLNVGGVRLRVKR